jgi:hypothetical protein
LRGRLGKWAYALVEYDLLYELLPTVKGQVATYLIVDHTTVVDNDACLVEVHPWRLFFDGSVCSKGQGVACVIVLDFDLDIVGILQTGYP